MRKMKLMTTYKELVQEKVHKQKLSNKKKSDRRLFYKGNTQLFKVQAFFFSPLITLWQKESRGPTKKKSDPLTTIHTPNRVQSVD